MRVRQILSAATFVTLAVAALSTTGCKKAQPPSATAPLSPEGARAFDHGVDFVAALGGLEGRWRTDYDADLDLRSGTSDLVAIMTVATIHTDTDPEQRVNHRLVGPVTRTIFGKELKEIELVSREDDDGYETIHEGIARLQNQAFVVYAKWYRNESGRREAHFHLSPATDEIVSQTEGRVALREGARESAGGEQIIVHTN